MELKPCPECPKLIEALETIVKYIEIMESIEIQNEFIKVYAKSVLEAWNKRE